jgi:chromosome segregation protein
MENFKSFGGKISIPLMEGYMAITGPNGSGKSNITDAILFVLGPKSSKAMRAGKLTDLIYSGNKDGSKADHTKVSLIFDNKDRMLPWDADEVKFTRIVKITRDGDGYVSYFYINDQPSSLNEFTGLLTKARISADGYNMVQQGDVTEIINMGKIPRRRIIDSISGIASYDADIENAQTEKAAAQENMKVITAVIGELEAQIKSLKADMEAARKYLEAKKQLDLANAQMVHRSLSTEEEKLKYTQENCAKLQADVMALEKTKGELRAKIEQLDLDKQAKEKEIADSVGPQYNEIKSKIESAKLERARADDAVERASESRSASEDELKGLEESLQETVKSIDGCSKSISDNDIKLEQANDSLSKAKADSERISKEMASKGGEHAELEKKQKDLESKIDVAGAAERDARVRASTAESVKENASRAVATLEERLGSADFEIKDADWNLSKMKQEAGPSADLSTFTNRILALKRQESELEKQETDLTNAVYRLNGDYNALMAEKKVTERFQGNEAVSAVLSLRDKGVLKGIFGTIAELGSAKSEFSTALSVAAGGKMQAIVVADDQVAADAIGILKKNKLGRALFLPLNKMMVGKPRAGAILKVKDTIGYAIDLVSFDEKYRAAFWFAFGDTMVVDSLDHARALMGGVRMVTLDGELLDASGAMTGGSLDGRQNSVKFGAASQSQLEKVGNDLRNANEALDTVRTRLRELRDQIREADDQMRAAGSGSVEIQGKIGKAEAQLKGLRDNRKSIADELAGKKDELTAAEKEFSEASADADAKTAVLEKLQAERGKVRDRIAEIAPAGMQEKIQQARDLVYGLNNQISDMVNTKAALGAELSGYQNAKASTETAISKAKDAKTAAEKTIRESSEKSERIKIDLDAMRAIEAKMESSTQGLRDERDKIMLDRSKADNDRNKAISDIETKNGLVLQAQANIEIINHNIDGLKTEVAQLTIKVEGDVPAEEELRRTIKSCEAVISRLGNVNLRAIEDYDEKSKRYESLKADMDRLEKQTKDLDGLVISLNAKKKGLFMDVYTNVNENFKKIFASLSSGGEAYMSLEDENDPFNGGLIINAKPRNGRMLRLEALSGGEKSLTALSFIFAIQEYQPSPFYVLDEVDMFLDSVNSEMVAQRIKQSSAKTQFIQVSLRKVTLALADHLIGVTRPPNGVSKVIMQPDLAEVSKYEEEAQRKIKEAEAANNKSDEGKGSE